MLNKIFATALIAAYVEVTEATKLQAGLGSQLFGSSRSSTQKSSSGLLSGAGGLATGALNTAGSLLTGTQTESSGSSSGGLGVSLGGGSTSSGSSSGGLSVGLGGGSTSGGLSVGLGGESSGGLGVGLGLGGGSSSKTSYSSSSSSGGSSSGGLSLGLGGGSTEGGLGVSLGGGSTEGGLGVSLGGESSGGLGVSLGGESSGGLGVGLGLGGGSSSKTSYSSSSSSGGSSSGGLSVGLGGGSTSGGLGVSLGGESTEGTVSTSSGLLSGAKIPLDVDLDVGVPDGIEGIKAPVNVDVQLPTIQRATGLEIPDVSQEITLTTDNVVPEVKVNKVELPISDEVDFGTVGVTDIDLDVSGLAGQVEDNMKIEGIQQVVNNEVPIIPSVMVKDNLDLGNLEAKTQVVDAQVPDISADIIKVPENLNTVVKQTKITTSISDIKLPEVKTMKIDTSKIANVSKVIESVTKQPEVVQMPVVKRKFGGRVDASTEIVGNSASYLNTLKPVGERRNYGASITDIIQMYHHTKQIYDDAMGASLRNVYLQHDLDQSGGLKPSEALAFFYDVLGITDQSKEISIAKAATTIVQGSEGGYFDKGDMEQFMYDLISGNLDDVGYNGGDHSALDSVSGLTKEVNHSIITTTSSVLDGGMNMVDSSDLMSNDGMSISGSRALIYQDQPVITSYQKVTEGGMNVMSSGGMTSGSQMPTYGTQSYPTITYLDEVTHEGGMVQPQQQYTSDQVMLGGSGRYY